MICPRTKGNCGCSHAAFCGLALNQIPTPALASLGVSVRMTADEFAAMARDAERLDWLDDLNKKFNERTGTTYGWKLDWTCNRWALSDCNLPALTVREAIDAAMAERNK